MNNENVLKELVESINKADAKNLKTDDDRVSYWKKEFDNKSALKWSEKTIDLENQYLKNSYNVFYNYSSYKRRNYYGK